MTGFILFSEVKVVKVFSQVTFVIVFSQGYNIFVISFTQVTVVRYSPPPPHHQKIL